MDAALKSGLYECEVVHQRLAPKRHGFRYQVFFMDLWLDELPQLHRQLKLFSFAGPNVFSFYDEDHLDLGAGNLRLNLQKWLREARASFARRLEHSPRDLPPSAGLPFQSGLLLLSL